MGIVWICIPVRILELEFYIAWHFPQRNYGLGKKRGELPLTKRDDRGVEKRGKECGGGREGVGGWWGGPSRIWARLPLRLKSAFATHCCGTRASSSPSLTFSGHIYKGGRQCPHPHIVAGITYSAGSCRLTREGSTGRCREDELRSLRSVCL